MRTLRGTSLVATTLAGMATMQPALAQDAKRIDAIEAQIMQLQQELRRMRSEMATRDSQLRAAQSDAARARAQAASRPQPNVEQAQQTQPGQGPSVQGQPSAQGQPVAQGQPSPGGSSPGAERASSAAGQAAGTSGPGGSFRVGGVTVTLGGFIAAEGVYRERNITADIGSSYVSIPTASLGNYHTGEFRGSARQSRLSLLAEGEITKDQRVAGYFESDFLGVGTASNSNESNSYVPRLRQAYLTYDNTSWGTHVLAGQAWSLLTLNRVGITPRQENIPLTIDVQYVPGFDWKRQWQLRVDQDFLDHRVWLGASLEEPQSVYYTGPNGLGVTSASGSALVSNTGGSLLNSTANYSNDIAPDLIVKAAFDPGWGHYEAFGVGKLLHDRVNLPNDSRNNTTVGGGGGGGAILPLIPRALDFQISGMAGYGIGGYASGQLPDAIVSSTGAPRPLFEYTILAGLVGHPTPLIDLYSYVGTEQISRASFNLGGKAYGYGNPLYQNGGCNIELSAASACVGNTQGFTQGTVGAWWRFLKGNFGTLQAGAQFSYTKRDIFAGAGTAAGTRASSASTDDSMVYFSFRYLPFQ